MSEVKDTINVINLTVLELVKQVYKAQEDGKISWYEGLSLGVAGTTAAVTILTAIKSLSALGLKAVIQELEDSQLRVE